MHVTLCVFLNVLRISAESETSVHRTKILPPQQGALYKTSCRWCAPGGFHINASDVFLHLQWPFDDVPEEPPEASPYPYAESSAPTGDMKSASQLEIN